MEEEAEIHKIFDEFIKNPDIATDEEVREVENELGIKLL